MAAFFPEALGKTLFLACRASRVCPNLLALLNPCLRVQRQRQGLLDLAVPLLPLSHLLCDMTLTLLSVSPKDPYDFTEPTWITEDNLSQKP